MDRVRTFYNDIAAWALDDPATWAPWVAPNPIPRGLMKGARMKNTRRQQNTFKQRTRTLAPWIPQLVTSVTAEKDRMRDLLAAAHPSRLAHPSPSRASRGCVETTHVTPPVRRSTR